MNSIMLFFAGSAQNGVKDTERTEEGSLIRVLTSFLALISLMSIPIFLMLPLESSYKRPILFCGYGFLAISSYSLGCVSAMLRHYTIVRSLCFLLSGLFGVFFGTTISLISPLTPFFMYSLAIQLLILIRLFVSNNYIERVELILQG